MREISATDVTKGISGSGGILGKPSLQGTPLDAEPQRLLCRADASLSGHWDVRRRELRKPFAPSEKSKEHQ
jgi:hypothetical protein